MEETMQTRLSIGRKIIVILLNFVILINLLLIGISFNLKNVVTKTAENADTAKVISDKLMNLVKEDLTVPAVKLETLENEIRESRFLEDITSKYIASIVEQLDKGATDFAFDINIRNEIEEIINLALNEMKNETNSIILGTLVNSLRQQALNQSERIEKSVNEHITTAVNNYVEGKEIYIKAYSILISGWFQLILAALLIFNFILLIADTKSASITLLSISTCFILTGLLYISIIYFYIEDIFHKVTNRYLEAAIDLSTTPVIRYGIIMLVAGICGAALGCFLLTYAQHNKKVMLKQLHND